MRRRAGVEINAAAASTGAGENFKGDMLAPSAANNNVVRALTVAAAVAAVSGGTTLLSPQGAAFVHVLAFGTLLGSIIFNTFIVGLTMFKNMPRQMFGRVQSKMFPKYFSLTTGAALVLLAGHALSPAGLVLSAPGVVALLVTSGLSVLNWLAIEPFVTGLMFQRYDIESDRTALRCGPPSSQQNKPSKTSEDEAEIKRLYGKFGMWHGISSLNNLAVLAAVVSYGWVIASKLAA
ncbi:hypothetical protein MNEG_8032 [Monoraphidium neglectum]|uniref:TMEM205-like domain-containing protein n=1 Tax=Monoraphidium neglectum TaxID=145388 RepID=A0A0D2KX96_9CHLO|nr:hypothetical protein MNEG_8032 [Monoraphidium neglectum]KIY99928.1 hypothetical protein MNEG_8032 [Monoraphidium neglectum]|eukprot:XP_013898948.1 hypothetical protein MNEG_8032 [Monoraphidium neglectum]